jgi:Ni/Co efflux regulator RcnB
MKYSGLVVGSLSLLAINCGTVMAQPHDDGRPDGGRPDGGHPPAPMEHHTNWAKGQRIGHDDWARGAPVDYHARHLREPPHGYEWRDVDGRSILAAVATGVIADVVVNAR